MIFCLHSQRLEKNSLNILYLWCTGFQKEINNTQVAGSKYNSEYKNEKNGITIWWDQI